MRAGRLPAPGFIARRANIVFLGVGIAKTGHMACDVDDTSEKFTSPFPFKNIEEGFERLVAWLEGVAKSPKDAFVSAEATGALLDGALRLLEHPRLPRRVVNPMQVKAMRELKGFSRVKNDLIAETLRLGDIDETRLATDDAQVLRSLTRYHQVLKQETACVKARLTCVMDSYFPEHAGVFYDMFGTASMAVLKKFALPHEFSRARASALGETIAEASHGRLGVKKAAQVKAAAKRSIGTRLGQDAAAFQIKTVVPQIEFLNSTCTKAEAKMKTLSWDSNP
ncbi:MAG: IS110 family transposase ISBth13 [Paraeggerthella hongkongensis]